LTQEQAHDHRRPLPSRRAGFFDDRPLEGGSPAGAGSPESDPPEKPPILTLWLERILGKSSLAFLFSPDWFFGRIGRIIGWVLRYENPTHSLLAIRIFNKVVIYFIGLAPFFRRKAIIRAVLTNVKYVGLEPFS
jgi:hypothetical protein